MIYCPVQYLVHPRIQNGASIIVHCPASDGALIIMDTTAYAQPVASLMYASQLQWNKLCGPDILLESSSFFVTLKDSLKTHEDYFRQITLFEALHNQQFFNGFGSFVINEILQRLYYYFGKALI
jgi:hypothetical protein